MSKTSPPCLAIRAGLLAIRAGLLAIACCVVTPAQQATLPNHPCFGQQQVFADGVDVYDSLGAQQGVGIGDFDGDGRVDFAGIRDNNGRPHIAFADPSGGTFTNVAITTETLDWVGDIQTGDFDGDGHLDLAIPSDGYSNDAPGELRVYINPAPNSRSSMWLSHTAFSLSDANHINDVRARDMDGDGRLDVVARSRSGPNRIIVSLQGNTLDTWTTFTFQTTYNSVGPEGIHVADLSGDGVPEIVGDGWFLTPTNTNTPWRDGQARQVDWDDGSRWYQERTKLWTDDINQDGRVDILVVKAENGDGDLSWMECTAIDPLFSTPADWTEHIIRADVGQMHHVESVDFDGDGDLDVFVGSFRPQHGGLRVFYNRDFGSSWTEDVIVPDRGCYHGGIVDQDGDGDLDLVAINGYRNKLFLYENLAVHGQANTPAASLFVAGAGLADRPGPFPACVELGTPFELRFEGPPNAAIFLLGSASLEVANAQTIGCIGRLDLDVTSAFTLSPSALLPPLTLDTNGRATASWTLPLGLPAAMDIAVQGFVTQPSPATCTLRATSAFEVRW